MAIDDAGGSAQGYRLRNPLKKEVSLPNLLTNIYAVLELFGISTRVKLKAKSMENGHIKDGTLARNIGLVYDLRILLGVC